MASDNGLPSSWEVSRLDEVSTIVDSLHKTPTYSASGYRMVRVTDVQGGYLDLSNALYVSDEVYGEFTKRHKPQRGDIVFSRVGSYGNASYVDTNEPFCLGQNTAIITPVINTRFLHQCIESPAVRRQIEETVVGSTQKTISLKNIRALRIPIPPKAELDAIANILGTLDDKIELNRRMNETLEAMARALFKSWFVDFDPVRAKMDGKQPKGMSPEIAALFPDGFEHVDGELVPKGWEVGSILNRAQLLSGGTPKTSESAYWRGTIPWASAKDVSQCGQTFLVETEKCITELGLNKSSTKMIEPNSTVIVARGATTGRMVMFGQAIAMNQTCYALRSSVGAHAFLYCFAREFVTSLVYAAHGSVFDTITTKTFQEVPARLPPNDLAMAFDELVQPLFERVLANQLNSTTLANLRDTLLPKLLSGEIRVGDAERAVEEVL